MQNDAANDVLVARSREPANWRQVMPVPNTPLSQAESVRLAHKIGDIPRGEVPGAIRRMIRDRELYRTVSALDDLLIDHPQHRLVAAKALEKIGLWNAG